LKERFRVKRVSFCRYERIVFENFEFEF